MEPVDNDGFFDELNKRKGNKSKLSDGLGRNPDSCCIHCESGWCKKPIRIYDRTHCEHYNADHDEAGGYLDEGGCGLAL